ncbi:VOC family protein [Streptomyces sp. NPDC001739]|uniref:VOC family protein n=1 Tax=Streptomyces siderophoricus TaxID=2802281 RepID=A0ABS1MQB5_9ACTN|nr:VOC family protein [Streptomyces sp. 9-7]MBL1089918.1 VOC family protein [Streptomyces sp. 9-7]
MPVTPSAVAVRGTPCWVSLTTHDLRRAQDFYAQVLGWTFRPGGLGEEFTVALTDGRPIAGVTALAADWQVSVAWTPYFAVASANDAAGRIRERGATIAVGPLRLGAGRVALAADRDGAVFGVWEGHTPAWAIGRGSAPVYLDLRTRDAFDATIFYAEVLDWASEEPGGVEVAYEHGEVLVRDGSQVVATVRGGVMEAAPDPHIRPRWHVQFPVEDVEKVAAAAIAAGGQATHLTPPADPAVAQALIRDPDGGLFTVTTG